MEYCHLFASTESRHSGVRILSRTPLYRNDSGTLISGEMAHVWIRITIAESLLGSYRSVAGILAPVARQGPSKGHKHSKLQTPKANLKICSGRQDVDECLKHTEAIP